MAGPVTAVATGAATKLNPEAEVGSAERPDAGFTEAEVGSAKRLDADYDAISSS
jgi:hypothetical protein